MHVHTRAITEFFVTVITQTASVAESDVSPTKPGRVMWTSLNYKNEILNKKIKKEYKTKENKIE